MPLSAGSRLGPYQILDRLGAGGMGEVYRFWDTQHSQRLLGGFDSDLATESFGISPDGSRMTVSSIDRSFNLIIAEHVPGVSPPKRVRH